MEEYGNIALTTWGNRLTYKSSGPIKLYMV